MSSSCNENDVGVVGKMCGSAAAASCAAGGIYKGGVVFSEIILGSAQEKRWLSFSTVE